jgi:hypothetical protein
MHYFLQTPHDSPFFAQRLQYLQFLQALHGLAPTHVAILVVDDLNLGLMLLALTSVQAARNIIRRVFFMMV